MDENFEICDKKSHCCVNLVLYLYDKGDGGDDEEDDAMVKT
jgi:hypothetical protein